MIKRNYLLIGVIIVSGVVAISILGGMGRIMKEDDVKTKFDKLYSEWKVYMKRPELQFSSNTFDYINCKAYEEIIKLGKPALPYIMEEMKKGQFFFNVAVHKITKIDIVPEDMPNDQLPLGEQGETQLWLEWWEKNKDE